MGVILLLAGMVILLGGLLSVHRPLAVAVMVVAIGVVMASIGINLTLGKARAENDRPVILVSRNGCYRFKVKGFVNMTCYETTDEARDAMLASPRYKKWKLQHDVQMIVKGETVRSSQTSNDQLITDEEDNNQGDQDVPVGELEIPKDGLEQDSVLLPRPDEQASL